MRSGNGWRTRSDLLRSVKEILLKAWDPIGVNQHEECKDEYDSYAPKVCRHLREGADEVKLASYLGQLRCGAMGLSPNEEKDRAVARQLLGLMRRRA